MSYRRSYRSKYPTIPEESLSGTYNDSECEALIQRKDNIQTEYSPNGPPHSSKWQVRIFLTLLSLFSATGGFLFGYDTGVVSGAMLKIDESFSLKPVWHELIVSVTIAAAAISAILAGPLTDFFGRRPVLLIASLVFTVGAVVMGVSPNKYVLLCGRVIVGIGIGFAAMSVPMYIAESAPAHMRGKLVVLNNLFITGGQFIATIIDGAFSSLSVNIGWRFMLGLAAVPSVIMFIGFLFMPETPRWLIFHGKPQKACRVLYKLRHPSEVEKEYKEIVADYEEYTKLKLGRVALMKKFFTSKAVIVALVVGCGLQMFQQLGGINTVMYYSASIIEMAGFSDNESIWLSAIPAFGNFIFTILGLILVDRLGRRKLLIGSLIGVIVGFLLLSGSFILSDVQRVRAHSLLSDKCNYTSCGTCVGDSQCGFCAYHNDTGVYINGTCSPGNKHHSECFISNNTDDCCLYSDYQDIEEGLGNDNESNKFWTYNSCPNNNKYAWLSLVALFIYIMFFAPGMGPLPWTINSEIYPTWARSTAISIATATNWIFNLFVSLTFLTFAENLGQSGTFGFYAGFGVLGLIFVVFLVPETKGRSLENMEDLFQRPYCINWCDKNEQYCLLKDITNDNKE